MRFTMVQIREQLRTPDDVAGILVQGLKFESKIYRYVKRKTLIHAANTRRRLL
jgi:hypothetical protein